MGESEISELERLAASTELISSIPYANQQRDKQVLFEFVRDYGNTLGLDVDRYEFGFAEDVRLYCYSLKQALANKELAPALRTTLVAFEALSLMLRPMMYPIAGGTARCNIAGDIVRICTPKYEGFLGLVVDSGAHELQHAYHFITYVDLYYRGLLTADCFKEIPFIEPGIRVPTKAELKGFERRCLKGAIKSEKNALSKTAS